MRAAIRRRWVVAGAAVVVVLAGLGALRARGDLAPAPAHAATRVVPAWLPALAGPVAPVTREQLGGDWLAMHPAPDLGIHAGGAVLLDLDTNEVLWARDPHGARPPASLTKLLTAMVAADLATSLDQQVTVPAEATQVEADSTVMGLTARAVVTRYPALLAMAGAKDVDLPATDTHQAYFLHSLIKLVAVYPGATGLKSGYTDDAGYCLVGTATRGDRHLAVVLLQSDLSLTVDATRLLDYGFSLPHPDPFDPATIP